MDETISMADLKNLAGEFWMKTGLNPTHVLMTTEQQGEFSRTLAPKERFVVGHPGMPDSNITTVYLNPTTIVDIVSVASMRSGHKNGLSYPKMVRFED